MRMHVGTRLGPYEILAPVGTGGMGEVWRARDTRLDRDVAIKILPEEFFEDAERRNRFEREAKLLAALNHPNIAAVFAFEEIPGSSGSPGRHLLAMELLEGESLRDALREGPLPPRRAIDLAAQIADGLAAAHAKGIIHRDLKPENVFLTKDGRSKILDFGLARHVPVASSVDSTSPTEARATMPGVVLGTIGYFSPEQVRGEPADHRSDIFAFGCVLHEMLSGKAAFKRETAAETMTAALREEAPTLSVSPELSALVNRCLEKRPELRFQSAQDLAFALRSLPSASGSTATGIPVATRRPALSWLIPGAVAFVLVAAVIGLIRGRQPSPPPPAPTSGPKRIAVLPFENLGSPEDGYFAAGITEEITSRLARVRSLAVISRTTATQYDRKGKTAEQIGKDLGVGYLLEGSVRWDKSGGGPGRVRITPQLIRVSDDTHLWADHYDRQLADIFAIQGDVADGVVRALGLALAPTESSAIRQLPTRDLQAYDLYLRALEKERQGFGPTAIAQKLEFASQAVEKDPQFAEALALLAETRLDNYWLFFDRRESELERARVEAERAVALRPDSAATHLALGYYHYIGKLDYEAALAEFGQALALQPNGSEILQAMGSVYRRQGRWREAEGLYRRALDGDSRNGSLGYLLGETQLILRTYPDAIRNLAMSSSLNPAYCFGHCYQAWAHVLWHGDVASSRRILSVASALPGLDDPGRWVDYFEVRTAEVARDWEAALRWLEARNFEAVTGQLLYIPKPLLRAEVLSYMGRPARARGYFEDARQVLAAKIAKTPEDARFHSSLGIALAGVGPADEAAREGERGVALMPPEKEAFRGVYRVEDLAHIYTMVGKQDAAIRQLEVLLSRPSQISVTLLKVDPCWDPLRKNPKFEALLAKYERKP
jgi:TolB-like protein/Flp pilus assembly protein TadD